MDATIYNPWTASLTAVHTLFRYTNPMATLYLCTYEVGAGCRMGSGPGGIRVEVLTN